MSNIVTRTIWGTLFVSIIISSILAGTAAITIVLGAFMTFGVIEFYGFYKTSEIVKPKIAIGVIGALALYASFILADLELLHFNLNLLIIPLLFLPFLTVVYSKNDNPLVDLTITFFAWIYVAVPFYLMYKIYTFDTSLEKPWIYLLGLFILTWSNDTFAYLTGRKFGKTRLLERISPKKSWEGAIGGFICTIISGIVFAYFTDSEMLFWIIAAIVISPANVLGDLIESRFKRLVDVKDSGTIIPGHGGILDRFDAVIYATPFFYIVLILLS